MKKSEEIVVCKSSQEAGSNARNNMKKMMITIYNIGNNTIMHNSPLL